MQNQISTSLNKVLMEHSHVTPLWVSTTLLIIQQQSWVVGMGTTYGPQSPKYLLSCPLWEGFSQTWSVGSDAIDSSPIPMIFQHLFPKKFLLLWPHHPIPQLVRLPSRFPCPHPARLLAQVQNTGLSFPEDLVGLSHSLDFSFAKLAAWPLGLHRSAWHWMPHSSLIGDFFQNG